MSSTTATLVAPVPPAAGCPSWAGEMALRYGVTVAEVSAVAWSGHTAESLVAAWDDFRQAVRDREALATGHKVWQHYYDPQDCSGQDQAIELKQSEADDAYRLLVDGMITAAILDLADAAAGQSSTARRGRTR
jgi:hypothetical protein